MTITLLGLLVQRREVAGKGQGKGRRRGRSESVRDVINRPRQKNDGRRVIERRSGY
jgi:hypothetical protein